MNKLHKTIIFSVILMTLWLSTPAVFAAIITQREANINLWEACKEKNYANAVEALNHGASPNVSINNESALKMALDIWIPSPIVNPINPNYIHRLIDPRIITLLIARGANTNTYNCYNGFVQNLPLDYAAGIHLSAILGAPDYCPFINNISESIFILYAANAPFSEWTKDYLILLIEEYPESPFATLMQGQEVRPANAPSFQPTPQAPQELIDRIAPQRNSIHLNADGRWILNSTIPFVALSDLEDRVRATIETDACAVCTDNLFNTNSVVICECSHMLHLPCFNDLLNFGATNERDADGRLLYNGTERIQYVKCPSCRAIMVPAYITQ